MESRVCCTMYKLAQGANILVCTENFAIGRSTVGKVLREVAVAFNAKCNSLIQWPEEQRMQTVLSEFKAWCGSPSIHGAIDGTHMKISKPPFFPEHYYYYKNNCYTMLCQAVVDCNKRFTAMFICLPSFVSDSRVFRKSGLCKEVHNNGLINTDRSCSDGIRPYLFGG